MDTVVIGAGLAGLAAAQRLVHEGRSVIVLEARGRLGGRVFTERDRASAAIIDYGPEWFLDAGGVRDVLAAAGETLYRGSGAFLRRGPEGWTNAFQDHAATSALLERIAKLPGADRSLRAAIAECGTEQEIDDARWFVSYVEGFHAADPDDVSAQWLAWMEATHSPGESENRALAGASAVVDALAADINGRCEVRLGAVVREVRWRAGAVEVATGNDSVVSARTAVVTVPLPMLTGGADSPGVIQFAPDITATRAAAARLRMGHAVKVIMQFKKPFWRTIRPLADMAFVFAEGQPFPTWWCGAGKSPFITGWVGGPKAQHLAMQDEELVFDAAISSLAHALAVTRRRIEDQLVSQHCHNWSADPFSRGAYSYVAAGGFDAHTDLARPVGDTLFFAGEATCGGGYNATMEGAVQSGWRAAAEVIAAAAR